ncbi:MAG: class I SAM-dependent methyltransferase [Alphaproteobacteria bacterium]|nr:MAG: class I SAM-dependent methyltransferase [Alphaproteobacteria bacterium]
MSCLKVGRPGPEPVLLDIFNSFFDRDGTYKIPFGHAGDVPYARTDFTGWTTALIGRREVPVPSNPEKLLAWKYGSNWKTPDPTFNWTREVKVRIPQAYPTMPQRTRIFWEDHFQQEKAAAVSTFAKQVRSAAGTPGAVLDLGCGRGADTIHLATEIRSVYGADWSTIGIKKADAAVIQADSTAIFFQCDFADNGRTVEIFDMAESAARKAGAPLLIYARRLFDAVPERVAATLIEQIKARAKPGDMVALELREFEPGKSANDLLKTYRRNVDITALTGELEAAGLEITSHDLATRRKADRDVVQVHRIFGRFA